MHYYLLFVVFNNKIYAPMSFKIVLKNYDKNFVKQEYDFVAACLFFNYDYRSLP